MKRGAGDVLAAWKQTETIMIISGGELLQENIGHIWLLWWHLKQKCATTQAHLKINPHWTDTEWMRASKGHHHDNNINAHWTEMDEHNLTGEEEEHSECVSYWKGLLVHRLPCVLHNSILTLSWIDPRL